MAIAFHDAVTAVEGALIASAPIMVAVAIARIKDLHIAVNGRMDAFIAATLKQSQEREAAILGEVESRVAGIAHSRDLLVQQNTQLIDHLAELAKRIEALPGSSHEPGSPIIIQEKPPCLE